jgi:hypothetical protein
MHLETVDSILRFLMWRRMICWILMKLRSIIDHLNIIKILMKKIKINFLIRDMIEPGKDQIIKNLEYKIFLKSNQLTRIFYWALK